MYHTGIDPRTMQPVHVAKTSREKAMQRALLQWKNPKNRALVLAALKEADREDLIGYGKNCLVPPVLKNSSQTVRSKEKSDRFRGSARHPKTKKDSHV